MRPTVLGLTLAALGAGAGCGGSDTPAPPSNAALQGTWATGCLAFGNDMSREVMFSGWNVTAIYSGFQSTDGSCMSQIIVDIHTTTYSLGPDVVATLSGAPVTAWEITLDDEVSPTYGIIYVNAGVTPAVLYVGDCTATQGLDCTAPAKRPTVLDAARPYRKQ